MINLHSFTLMEFTIFRWVVTIAGIFVLRFMFRKSIRIRGIVSMMTVAFVIAPINVFIEPIVVMLGMPPNFGILLAAAVFLNSLLLYGGSAVVPDFFIENFNVALTFSVLLAGFTVLMTYLLEVPLFPGQIHL